MRSALRTVLDATARTSWPRPFTIGAWTAAAQPAAVSATLRSALDEVGVPAPDPDDALDQRDVGGGVVDAR